MDILTWRYAAGPIQLVVWEVLYVAILALVLMAVLNRFLFKPVLAVLDERKRRLAESQGSQDDLLRLIDERRRQVADRLAQGRRRALETIEAAKSEAEARRQESVGAARASAEARIGDVEGRLAAQAASAEAQLRQDAAALARRIASRLLGREVAA